jgi:ParB/RepB/Spo0J family partition protein
MTDFRDVLLAELYPSPTNPRKSFDPAELAELSQSIATSGVQVRLLVRLGNPDVYRAMRPGEPFVELGSPAPDVYEIVAGERRFRAANLAGLTKVPCEIRLMTDREVLEVQVIENLHRADVHPLEEARAYQVIGSNGEGLTVEEVAKRVGKATAYVAQRLKLLQLELPAQLLFKGRHIALDHALIVARLTPADQTNAVREMLGANHQPKKMDLVVYTERRIKEHAESKYYAGRRLINMTAPELKAWVERSVMLKLKGVPWKLEDATLVPEAGACTTCQKRSGSNVALFGDLTAEEDICLDSTCYATKHKALVKITIAKAKEDGGEMVKLSARQSESPLPEDLKASLVIKRGQWVRAGAAKCEDVVQGIVVDASGQQYEQKKIAAGDVFKVCCNQKCKVHKHTVQKLEARGVPYYYEAERSKAKAYEAAETPIRVAIVKAIAAKAKVNTMAQLREEVENQCGNDAQWYVEIFGLAVEPVKIGANDQQKYLKAFAKFLTGASLEQLALCLYLVDVVTEAEVQGYQHDHRANDRAGLWKLAKAAGVDAEAIAKAAEPAQAKEEAAKPKTAAKKAAKKASGNRGMIKKK